MRKAVGFRLRTLGPARTGGIMAALIALCLHPLPVLRATDLSGSFRPGLSFSQTRPLTPKQQAALLEGLRQRTGFSEIRCDGGGFLVLGNRARIRGGSVTARTLVSAVVDGRDSYTIESYQRSPEVAFARIQGQLDYVNVRVAPRLTRHSWSVAIDFHDYGELRGQAEAIRAFDPALTLLHELAHAVMNLRDSAGETDSLGDCERYINQIRRELGLPERQSYESVNTQTVTPYGAGQRILAELSFVRVDPGNRIRRFRLTFDVENVFAAGMVKRQSAGIGGLARADLGQAQKR